MPYIHVKITGGPAWAIGKVVEYDQAANELLFINPITQGRHRYRADVFDFEPLQLASFTPDDCRSCHTTDNRWRKATGDACKAA